MILTCTFDRLLKVLCCSDIHLKYDNHIFLLYCTLQTPPQTEIEEEVTDSLMTPSLVEVPVKKDGSDTTNGM